MGEGLVLALKIRLINQSEEESGDFQGYSEFVFALK